jgi:hypothetical protein
MQYRYLFISRVPVAVCVPDLHSAIRILLFPRPFLRVVRDLRLILLHTDMIKGTESHDPDTSFPAIQWRLVATHAARKYQKIGEKNPIFTMKLHIKIKCFF